MPSIQRLIRTLVAIHLPLSAVSMQTQNGYLCNLCHSLQNDHPFPPPSAEAIVVRFNKTENEKYGLPWDRGVTCIEVWNTVLDYANSNVYDEQSCRSMAAAYAPQCCNDVPDQDQANPVEQQKEQGNADKVVVGTIKVKELSATKTKEDDVLSTAINNSDEETENTRPSRERISSSNTERNDGDNGGDNDNNTRRTTSISYLRGNENRR